MTRSHENNALLRFEETTACSKVDFCKDYEPCDDYICYRLMNGPHPTNYNLESETKDVQENNLQMLQL